MGAVRRRSHAAGSQITPDEPATAAPLKVEGAATPAARAERPPEADLRLLYEVSRVLAGSLDYDTTLTRVAELMVPALADGCIVHVVQEDGALQRLALIHGDPAMESVARELERRYPPGAAGIGGVAAVVRTGQSLLYAEVSEAGRIARASDPDHLRLLQATGSRSAMIVPLVARERTLGAISFLSARPDRRYGNADLQLAEELARGAALAIDNARLYHKARVSLAVGNEVLSLISHDLLQPLAAISSSAELLQDDAGNDTHESAWLVARIDSAARRMTLMINDLLDVARQQAGLPLELHALTMDLAPLVRNQVEAYQKTTERHQIHLDMLAPELVSRWDKSRLERVVGNLLSNAIRYSPDGGDISVVLSRESDAAGEWARLVVRDTGVGIPSEDLPRIFEGFFRGRNVAGQISGSGIGLLAARQIVEQHGGVLTIESAEGVGTVAAVRLPLIVSSDCSD